MAVAVLSKKKLKSRSKQRSPSSRALEDEDEDAAIISLLEREPWQPDLLLERRSDKPLSPNLKDGQTTTTASTLSTTLAGEGTVTNHYISGDAHHTSHHVGWNAADTTAIGQDQGQGTPITGFQGVIPVIIKSPSSIISEVTESDYLESIADTDDHPMVVVPEAKIRGIEEYLQQTHQEQQLLQQQQQAIQMQMQMRKEKDRERERELEKQREHARDRTKTGDKEEGMGTRTESGTGSALELQLQYQLPPHLRTTTTTINGHDPLTNSRSQSTTQHRNSYHGPMLAGPFLDHHLPPLQERTSPLAPAYSLTSRNDTLDKMASDDEDVVESLQSLKNITMLALDGLLQQVVSDVTASDPIHNADETTLEARAVIRRRSIPLLDFAGKEPNEQVTPPPSTTTRTVQRAISDSPIAGVAASSLERLDELARKVDQLTAVAAEEHQQQQQGLHALSQNQGLHGTALASTSTRNVGHILSEPAEIPERQQQQEPMLDQGQRERLLLDPAQVFESEEYQLACALAAMLACIYRILNRMQQQQHQPNLVDRPRTPQRTESVDSGLDQASKLWKRLSSNTSVKNPLRPSPSYPGSIAVSKSIMGSHFPTSPERKVMSSQEASMSPRSSISVASGTNSFIQTINKQVKTLRSRRSQSTSHIEVSGNRHGIKSLQGRLLSGLQFGSNKTASPSTRSNLYPEELVQLENARELEKEWSELDRLMDEMTRLWRFVESIEHDQVDMEDEAGSLAKMDSDDDHENNPFHDRHQVPPPSQQQRHQHQQQQQNTTPTGTMGMPYTMSATQNGYDQQTFEMLPDDDPPLYEDDVPDYKLTEKPTARLLPASSNTRQSNGLIGRTSRSLRNITGHHSKGKRGGLVDDEKTRFDLNNVMSAIERLSKVAPRLDNQRVQLSSGQKKHMARASIAHTFQRLSRDRWDFQIGSSSSSSAPASASASSAIAAAAQKREAMEKRQDLDKLINQIVESANKASNSSFSTAQRAEFSPKQQWKLESARMGDRIERGEKLRMSDQDYSPEKVLLQDMTRLTNALYQQSASSKAFATQRFTLTEDKARNMALQGILSKIERVSSRRMGNQDATAPSSVKSKPTSPSSICSGHQGCSTKNDDNGSIERAKELQEMINQVMESGGGPTRKTAMASQRAQFGPKQ